MVAYGQFTISVLSDGTSVDSVTVQYYLSTSRTQLSGGSWGTTCPAVSDGHYVWTRTGIKLSDSNTVSYSQAACITGDKGQTGSSGQGIVSVTPMYIMNESKETVAQPPTGWTEDPTSLEWESGKYIWTTSKIVYQNPSSTVYTTPSCDTAWEAANAVQDNLNAYITTNDQAVSAQAQTLASHTSSINSISSTVDQHTNQIASKVSQTDFNSSITGLENDIDKSTGINKWLVEIYLKTSLPEANRTLYDFAAFTGSGINPTSSGTYLDANISKSFLTTKSYIGYALTFVNVTTQFTWTHGFSASGNGRLYVNGSQVSGTTVTMEVGWNVVEVIWNVGTTTPNGFAFTSKLGTNSNVLLMNCYHRTITGREASEVTRTSELLIGLDGITSRVSSAESNINTNAGNINTLNTNVSTVTQTANKINWLVTSQSSSSSVTLTDAAVTAVTNQFVIKDPDGSATIISGGKIAANSITANMLAANAIKSQNYLTYNSQGQQVSDGAPYNSPYSSLGTFLDLSNGFIYTPNFGVSNGNAYINGEIIATSGKIGGESGTYWEISPVEEDSVEHAAIISNGNAFINTGQWTIKADRINSQSVDAQKNLVYPSYNNRYYDFGVHVPELNPTRAGYIQGVSDDFLYIRYHDNTVPELESDWNYIFRVDKNGMIYINGNSLDQKYASIDGVSGAYLPRTGGTITQDLTVEGNLTIEGNLTGNASSASQLNNAITVNGRSFNGSSAVDVGTIGVAYGGTGNTSWTAGGIIYASSTDTLGQISSGTSGQILKSNGNTAPSWVNQSSIAAGSATKDSSGHTISSYFAPLSGATFTGAITANDGITADEIETGDLTVTGTATFSSAIQGNLTGNVTGNLTGIASKAAQLETARTISLTGDVAGSVSFNGSENVSITATVADNSHNHTVSNITGLTADVDELNYMDGVTSSVQDQLDDKAPIDSPEFTGTPTAPTAALNTNTTQVATTAFVNNAVNANVPVIESTHEADNGTWTGNAPFNSLQDGQVIFFHLLRTPSGSATLNLTLANGTTTGAIPCYYNNGTTRLNTQFGKSSYIPLVYTTGINSNGDEVTRWMTTSHYDTNYYDRLMMTNDKAMAGTTTIFGSQFIGKTGNGTWASITTSRGTGTAKTKSSEGFVPGTFRYYSSSTAVTAGNTTATSTVYVAYGPLIDYRYSTNLGSTLVAYNDIYFKFTCVNGLLYLADNWATQTLPTTEDGYIYVLMGKAYDTYRGTFSPYNPMFIFKNGYLRLWVDPKNHDHTISDITDLTATATELNVLDGITASTAELNILDGVTATAAEINHLDGITASVTELNYVDGVTSAIQPQINAKAASLSLSGTSYASSNGVISVTKANLLSAIGQATSSANGYMLKEDKEKLDSISVNASGQIVSASISAEAPIGQGVTPEGVTIVKHNTSGVSAGTYGASSTYPYRIPNITVDTYGHVTSISNYDMTGANIVNRIGTNAVARATGDANGNAIASTYLKLSGGTMTGNITATGHTITADTFTGALTGNASTATTLKTARTIALSGGATGTATSFNGSKNITIPVTALDASKLSGEASVDTTGNAATASALETARTISLSGDVSGEVSFDGSEDAEIVTTVADNSHNHDCSTIVPIASKTYEGVYISANDAANGMLVFCTVRPDAWAMPCRIKYRVIATVPGQPNYGGSFVQTLSLMRGTLSYYANQVAHYSTSYRTFHHFELYRLKEAGFNNGYGHALALKVHGSANPTSPDYARTFTIEILETKNCTVTMLDNMTKYGSIAGTGSTNYESVQETNGADNGLREMGDDNTITTLYYYNHYVKTSSANGLFSGEISGRTTDGTYQSIVTVASSTTTDKTRNTAGFDPTSFFWYSGTNRTTAGNYNIAAYKFYSGTDFRQSSNCGSTLVTYKPVFIVGTMSNGYFYLDETWWTQDLPTTEDGKVYIYIGQAYSTTNVSLAIDGRAYEYKDGHLQCWNDWATHSYDVVKLKNARTVRTNLASTSTASFDGTADISPGVTGTLPVANGGTGVTSIANIQAGKDGSGNTITSYYVTLSTAQTVSGAKTFSGATAITNTTASTNKSTGALKVSGGVGVAGQMSANKVMVGDNVTLEYDSAKSCLNFVFA